MHKSRGFTLIELMIVVAIIAILLAVILPLFQSEPDTSTGVQSSGNYTESQPQRLVCTKDGATVIDEPAIPGERWYFENGTYVTNDSRGNPVTRSPVGDCSIQ